MGLKGAFLAGAVVLVSSCQLFTSGTRVRFVNATSAQTVSQLSFGSAAYQGPLGPGQSTAYFPVEMGTSLFSAEQNGTPIATMQFAIGAEASYTVTFSDYYQTNIALSGFGATGTITVNGVTFTAVLTATSPPSFSVASGSDSQDLAELSTCIADPTFGAPGVTAGGTFLSSSSAPVVVSSAPVSGTCTATPSNTMTVSFRAD